MNKENASELWRIIQEAVIIYGTREPHYLTLLHTSYTDNLKFIKNKPHKESLKTLLKLVTDL